MKTIDFQYDIIDKVKESPNWLQLITQELKLYLIEHQEIALDFSHVIFFVRAIGYAGIGGLMDEFGPDAIQRIHIIGDEKRKIKEQILISWERRRKNLE